MLIQEIERRGGPMVSVSDSGSVGLGSIPGRGDHGVSLGKILYSLVASSSRIRTLSRRSRLLSSNPVVDVKEPLKTQVRPSSVSVLDRITSGHYNHTNHTHVCKLLGSL